LASGRTRCQRQASAHLERATGAREASFPGPAGDQGPQERAAAQGDGHGRDDCLAGAAKKVGEFLLGGRGSLTSAVHRRKAIELIGQTHATGAVLLSSCSEIAIFLCTLKRWRMAFLGDGDGNDPIAVKAVTACFPIS